MTGMSVRPIISSRRKRVRRFFISPLISADNGDPENFHIGRLNQQQKSLDVAAAGPGTIFVDNDFTAALSRCKGAGQNEKQAKDNLEWIDMNPSDYQGQCSEASER